jgi:hypothetical protein
MKERLIELLEQGARKAGEHLREVTKKVLAEKGNFNSKTDYDRRSIYEVEADFLLENGIVVPPCKAGDVVYAIYNKKVYESIAEQVTVVNHISGNKIIKIKAEFDVEDWFYNDGRKIKYGIYGYYQDNVFLTKEEAEQALTCRKSRQDEKEGAKE